MTSLLRLGAFFVPLFALTQVLRYCTQAYKTMVPSVVVGNIVQPLLRLLCASALIVAGYGVGGAVVSCPTYSSMCSPEGAVPEQEPSWPSSLGNNFYACTGPTGFLLSMTGHPRINLVNSAVAVVLYVTLGVLVVPHHGVIGIAAVDASVTALVNGARLVEAKWLVGVHPFGRSLAKPVIATSIAVVVLRVSTSLLGDRTGRLGALALGGAVYIGALWRMGLDPEERAVWTGIKRRASHVVDGLGWR